MIKKLSTYFWIIINFLLYRIKNVLFYLETSNNYHKDIIKDKNKHNVYAFVDLQTIRTTFDIVSFMVYLKSIELFDNKKKINLVILPDNQKAQIKIAYQKEKRKLDFYKHIRNNNIALKSMNLVENFNPNIFIISNKKEMNHIYSLPKNRIIPSYFHKFKPTEWFKCYHELLRIYKKKGKIAKLTANASYLKLVSEYLRKQKIDKRKLVTITLRNSSYNKFRNSNVSEWLKVYNYLKSSGFYPILIHDFESASIDDKSLYKYNTYNYANLDIETRMALYEISFINLLSGSGTSLLVQLSKNCNFIDFYIYTKESLNITKKLTGINFGEHFPWYNKYQKFKWVKRHSSKFIINEFEKLKNNLQNFN